MKPLQQVLAAICLLSTAGWTTLALKMIWSDSIPTNATTVWRVTASLVLLTLGSMVALGALYYARERSRT